MNFKGPEDLLLKWKELCQSQYSLKNLQGPTIGLELEFFLLDQNDLPVGLSKSQEYFSQLRKYHADLKQTVNYEEEILAEKKCISRVKLPTSDVAWTSVSYEYPPHFLELSLSYHGSLNKLHEELQNTLGFLQECAKGLNLKLGLCPILDKRQIAAIERIDNKAQKELRASRIRMINEGPHKGEEHWADFPSFLAATHIHVAGHRWWENEKFVENLYRLEPHLMLEANGMTFKERWNHYQKVFYNFPLLGFPHVKNWSMKWWFEQLFNLSYQTQKSSIATIHNLNKLRDLQVIRPRAIGTIEFRSDSAQSTPEKVMHLAALRFGQYLVAEENFDHTLPSLPNYEKSETLWHEQMNSNCILKPELKEDIFALIHKKLSERGNGDEKFLKMHKAGKTS